MFALAILIGIYSYVIFALGVAGILYKPSIAVATILFALTILIYFRKVIKKTYGVIKRKEIKLDKFSKLLILLILAQVIVNLIGVLGPELSFDALWYHLTLPKIFLSNHSIYHIPGGLLYYSDMPKLGEMLYASAIPIGGVTLAKLIHFTFGILTLVSIFKLSRKFFNIKFSLLACVIFYANLVVAWESTTAYIDLFRAFFEITALLGFINYFETKDKKWLLESSVVLGLAISTKLIAIGSLFIFVPLIFLANKNIKNSSRESLFFIACSLFFTLPWFFYSLLQTGNPFYPLLTKLYPSALGLNLLNPLNMLSDFVNLFLKADDPISPIYIILLPLLVLVFRSLDKRLKIISIYCLLSLIAWYLIPRTGGGRFIMPYLPAFSILAVGIITNIRNKEIKKYLIYAVIFISLTTLFYRGAANARFIPVVLGIQSKDEFLTQNLNFKYGDFYDTDSFFKNNIKTTDRVLLYGFHNLFYADFPFIDNSYIKRGDSFNYIAVQDGVIPKRFSFWDLVYENPRTGVKLYSLGGMTWHY